MTPESDNGTIFLLKIGAEGNNLIVNSDFDADATWSKSGDWTIGSGVGTYSYVDDATGDLNQTIAAAITSEYILEYTVTEVTIVTAFNFYLRGGAGLFSTLQIELDKTIGKHTITFLGNDTETTFGLGVAGMEAGESISIDDIKVRLKEESITVSTRSITLDSTDYDGAVLGWNELSDFTQYIDAESGGGIGAVSGFDFTISRHTLNTRTSSFFNEFFPAYSGGMVITRPIQFGIVWNTATTLAEITWLFKGRVLEYSIEPRKLHLIVLQETEFDALEVPYYSIQKDFDNGVSYFPNINDEDSGVLIPIVYGDFSGGTSTNYRERGMRLAPAILINPAKDQILISSHKCDAVSYNQLITDENVFYKEVGGAYQAVYNPDNTTYVNNDLRHTISMQEVADGDVKGAIYLPLEQLSDYSEVQEISNLLDTDITDYVSLNGGDRLAMRVGTSFSTSEFGALGVLPNDVQIVFWASTDGGGNREITFGYYNKTLSAPPYSFSTSVTLTLGTKVSNEIGFGHLTIEKKDAIIPWTIEELCNLEFFVQNNEAAGSYVYIYEAYIFCGNIIVSGYSTKYKATIKRGRFYGYEAINPPQRYYVPGYGYTGSWYGVNKSGNVETTNSSLFVYVKGREYGRWAGTVRGGARAGATHSEGDLIEHPIGIIESLLRDEKYTERDLGITSSADTTHFVCIGSVSKANDYYNDAGFYNATRITAGETKSYITDYAGDTNIFTINDAITGMAAGDNFYLTNIQGDYKIDDVTFDTVEALRSGWKFARSINTKQSFQGLIDEILFESHCSLFESADEDGGYSKVKVIALDKDAPNIGTISSPIKAISNSITKIFFESSFRENLPFITKHNL